LGKCYVGSSRQRHTVVVIEIDQLAELQMARQRCGLRGYALHQVPVADDSIGEVIDDLEAGAVVTRGEVAFGNCETDAIAKALTKRSRGRLDAGRDATFGMARRHTAPFAKPFDLFKRKIIAGKVKQTVQQHRT